MTQSIETTKPPERHDIDCSGQTKTLSASMKTFPPYLNHLSMRLETLVVYYHKHVFHKSFLSTNEIEYYRNNQNN